jgi:hypothetical protein
MARHKLHSVGKSGAKNAKIRRRVLAELRERDAEPVLTSFVECYRCGGSGEGFSEPCRECRGTGMVEDDAELVTLDDFEEEDARG